METMTIMAKFCANQPKTASRFALQSPPPPYSPCISSSYLSYLVLFLCFVAETQAQTPTASITSPSSLTETNLNNAEVTVTLTGSLSATSGNAQDNFELVTTRGTTPGATIPGLSLHNTRWTSRDSTFTVRLVYDGSDFDTDGTLAIKVKTAGHTGSNEPMTGTIPVTAVDETTPGQVMGVSVTAGSEQLTVTWTAVSGASGYKVQWKSGGEMYNTITRQATPTGTSHTITGLTGGTEYTVRVRATKTKADDGSFSDEATGTPGPGQVMGVSVTAGSEQLTVTWTAVTGASGYQVQWKSGSQDYDNTRQATTTNTSHTIPSLTGGTEYTVRVRATGTPDGPFSAEATGTPGLGQVMGVTVTSGPGQLQVAWTSVTGATGYKVQWKSGSQGYDNTRQATPTTNSHTIAGLTPDTEYTVRVLATRSSTPDGPASSEATGTPGLAQVTGVRVTAGTRQLQVAWNTVLGAIGYKVQWKSGSESYNTTDRQATTANTNYTITNLDPAVYTLRVLATRSGLADGPASNEQVAAPLGNTDYDQNNNNLIDLTTLAQLDAIRYDLDGNGSPTGNVNAYNLAFPGRATDMGCPTTCTGYELMNDLDFDENGNGARDDSYNRGAGWNPISTFTVTLQGNGHVIANLFINRSGTDNVGLFGVSTGRLTQLGLVNVEITGRRNTGGLLGENLGTVSTSYVIGRVTAANERVGGLVGINGGNRGETGTITASYARVQVSGFQRIGGLVGLSWFGTITTSYASGRVTGSSNLGGLVGSNVATTITASYWDTETSGVDDDADTTAPEGKTTAELQTPTGYTGIYADWNIDVDGVTGNDNPWAFGSPRHYPVLRYGRTQAQIYAQFNDSQFTRVLAVADVNQDFALDEQDALLMYRTYLEVPGPTEDQRAQATAWQRQGRAVGGDLNGDGDINEQDALIMYYAYQFRALLQNHAALRQLLFNGLRGSGHQPMPPTDATYQEFLRRALRLR